MKKIITSRAKALKVARIASDKKANEVVVLDMRKVTNICDYFVIMSCESERKAQGILEAIEEALEKNNIRASSIEGRTHAEWIVLDYLDIIVHIFYQPKREFYNLERLWKEAPRLKLTKAERKTKKSRKPSKKKLRKPHG